MINFSPFSGHSTGKKNNKFNKFYDIINTFRRKFGELFYRVVIISMERHYKGLVVETGILLDPNEENYNDILRLLQEQVC